MFGTLYIEYLLSEHHTIIRAIAHGDRQAFKELYQLFSDQVYNTALSYTQDVQEAEEITQDVFTQIFRNAVKFKGESAVGTWIYRITINTSLNYLRRRKRFGFMRINDHNIDKPDFEHPGVLLERKEDAKALFKVIDTLPNHQKTAFILSFIEDLPRQEVADIMQVSLKAVESLLQRAKKNLRNKLEKIYPERRKNNY
ncbi:MAG: RNA polymerase sigma factor [Bacteroidota bacterium]